MMFRKNEELDVEGLDDFIEKPSQDFKEEKELKKGVDKVIFVLGKNPSGIMNIIKDHPYIPATFLLDDLAEKMKMQGCLSKLGLLFDKCSDELVGSCVYNLHDLERCINALPGYSEKIIKIILFNEDIVKRIFEAEKNPEGTLKEIAEKYPSFIGQFSECYNKYFKVTPAP